ncbi:hypothetical protein HMPREF9211_1365 [Lactobacillus iners LactinV 01V1-a]|uniref:YitT family protein n=1 Tax=Lactobacillus iners LactinV 01V1-a TaxID=879297 RepID=E1NRM2_9LACO|nr:hypothetical protein HMPREF9211_1365 [Lactobacillus iners LactinV 01V1-a]
MIWIILSAYREDTILFPNYLQHFFIALAVAVALNFFWHPGKIYASGVTGFSQVLESLSSRYLPFTLTTSSMYFVLNIPLFILGWLKIGKKFTLFTIIAVILASIMMKLIAPIKLSYDPIICAIFGGVVNGVGTGIALKSGISTGGIDVLGIILRRKTGKSFGQINIFFNLIIVICAGFCFWLDTCFIHCFKYFYQWSCH